MQKKYYYLLFIPILVVYIINLTIDVMAIDAAQYAEMSWEMFTTKSFLKVHLYAADYLDKPPLLFWLNSLSFCLFGINNISYKLPSLLFAILAILSTYRFAKIYYSLLIATIAALMLASTEALFLITNDVRTDTLLMGAVAFAIWQWAQFFETPKTINLLLGSVGIGLALLAKGPIGLIAVGAAFLPHLIVTKKWRYLLDLRTIISLVLITLILIPMCVGLYQQWGWDGIKFYFWTQSFGRITGASKWNNNPDTFFLLHTTLWAFLPWSLFLFAGWADRLSSIFGKKTLGSEIISMSGLTLVTIALMLSKYQLPHYIFIVYPLGAIIAADYFIRISNMGSIKKILTALQLVLVLLIVCASLFLHHCFLGLFNWQFITLILSYIMVISIIAHLNEPIKNAKNTLLYLTHSVKRALNKNKGMSAEGHIFFDFLYRNLFMLSLGIMLVFNLFSGLFYFPAIMKYQPGNDFGRYAHQHSSGNNYVAFFCEYGFADVFYAQKTPYFIWDINEFNKLLKQKKHLIVKTSPVGIDQLNDAHTKYRIIDTRYNFAVAKLTATFLNPATRNSVCDKVYLLEADE